MMGGIGCETNGTPGTRAATYCSPLKRFRGVGSPALCDRADTAWQAPCALVDQHFPERLPRTVAPRRRNHGDVERWPGAVSQLAHRDRDGTRKRFISPALAHAPLALALDREHPRGRTHHDRVAPDLGRDRPGTGSADDLAAARRTP